MPTTKATTGFSSQRRSAIRPVPPDDLHVLVHGDAVGAGEAGVDAAHDGGHVAHEGALDELEHDVAVHEGRHPDADVLRRIGAVGRDVVKQLAPRRLRLGDGFGDGQLAELRDEVRRRGPEPVQALLRDVDGHHRLPHLDLDAGVAVAAVLRHDVPVHVLVGPLFSSL